MQKMQTLAKSHVTNHNNFEMLLSKLTHGENLRYIGVIILEI